MANIFDTSDFNQRNDDIHLPTNKFFCGQLRVKQPQELMDHPPEEQSDNSQLENIDPAAKFGPRVTARQLNKALVNLQTKLILERGSVTPLDGSFTPPHDEPEEHFRDVLQGPPLQPSVNIETRYTNMST